MAKDEDIQLFFRTPKNIKEVVKIIEEALSCKAEIDGFPDPGIAAVRIRDAKAGFRQAWSIMLGRGCRCGRAVEFELAGKLANEIDDLVLLENKDDQFNWFLFSPGGSRNLIEIFDTSDSVNTIDSEELALVAPDLTKAATGPPEICTKQPTERNQ